MFEPSQLVSADLSVFFAVGLLGGAHCIGMCGPLVTIYASNVDAKTGSPAARLTPYEVRQHGLFNLGRTVSYATIGAICGTIGNTLFVTAETMTTVADLVRGSVGAVVGLFVVGTGIYYLRGRVAGRVHPTGLGLEGLFGLLSTRLTHWATGPGIVGLGALHGLLPCPILYPAFLYAFAVGDPIAGFLSLGVLGLGTFPAVFLYGTLVESVDPARRRRLHRLLGLAFVVLGYLLFAHGMMAVGIGLPHPDLPRYQPLVALASGH